MHLSLPKESPPALSPPALSAPAQDHGVFGHNKFGTFQVPRHIKFGTFPAPRHIKFGTYQVPKTFLNFNEEAEQCALKVAEKGAAKQAAKEAVATPTNQKTVLTKTDQAKTDQKAKNKAAADEALTVAKQGFPAKSSKEERAACEQTGRQLLPIQRPHPRLFGPEGCTGRDPSGLWPLPKARPLWTPQLRPPGGDQRRKLPHPRRHQRRRCVRTRAVRLPGAASPSCTPHSHTHTPAAPVCRSPYHRKSRTAAPSHIGGTLPHTCRSSLLSTLYVCPPDPGAFD